MVIQFQCIACGQPIEVDDEWVLKRVACPYCRKTITAPAESELSETDDVPVASVLSTANPLDPAAGATPIPARTRSTLSKVALGLALSVIVLMMVSSSVLMEHKLEIQMLQDRIAALADEGMGFMEASQRASFEFFDQYGGVPPKWLLVAGLLQVVAAIAWVGAAVCGLISVVRRDHGRFAWIALAITGIMPILFCGGLTTA